MRLSLVAVPVLVACGTTDPSAVDARLADLEAGDAARSAEVAALEGGGDDARLDATVTGGQEQAVSAAYTVVP